MARFTSKHTNLVFIDNVGNSLPVGPGSMDLQIGPLEEDNSEAIAVMNNGVHDGLVEGDDIVQDWSITLELKNELMTSAGAARILDWFRKTNYYAAAGVVPLQSVDSCKWAWKGQITMFDGTTSSGILLPKMRGTVQMSAAKEGWRLAASGQNWLAPVFT